MKPKTLKGDNNQCPTCGEYFKSVFAFVKHRVGGYEPNTRRCLTEEQMRERGMDKNARGFWVSARNTTLGE